MVTVLAAADGKARVEFRLAGWAPAAGQPWEDQRILNATIDLVVQVRDLDPADLVTGLAKVDPQILARIAVTAAALVPDDATAADLLDWASPQRRCVAGHVVSGENAEPNGVDGSGRLRRRCRACERESSARYRARRSS